MQIINRQALQIQVALKPIMEMILPVETSLKFAFLAATIDEQLLAYAKVRDQLLINYKIKLRIGDSSQSQEVIFEMAEDDGGNEESREEFIVKMNELLLAFGPDITVKKIKLSTGLALKPEILKPLLPFVELE